MANWFNAWDEYKNMTEEERDSLKNNPEYLHWSIDQKSKGKSDHPMYYLINKKSKKIFWIVIALIILLALFFLR